MPSQDLQNSMRRLAECYARYNVSCIEAEKVISKAKAALEGCKFDNVSVMQALNILQEVVDVNNFERSIKSLDNITKEPHDAEN